MGSFLSDTFIKSSNPLQYCKYVYVNIYDSNIATAELLVISVETACWLHFSHAKLIWVRSEFNCRTGRLSCTNVETSFDTQVWLMHLTIATMAHVLLYIVHAHTCACLLLLQTTFHRWLWLYIAPSFPKDMVILTILVTKEGIPQSSHSLYHLFGCGILITPCGHLVPQHIKMQMQVVSHPWF
jgi:hypothetical protein